MLVDRKEIFHTIPCLDEHREDAVGLRARTCRDALGHLLLYHTGTAGDEILVVQHLEEYLTADIVGIVARQHKGAPLEQLVEAHAQEVVLDDVPLQCGEVLVQIGHRLAVYLHHLQLARLRDEKLGHHTHAGSHFEDGQVGAGIHRVGNVAGDGEVGQEMLTQGFLWLYVSHP